MSDKKRSPMSQHDNEAFYMGGSHKMDFSEGIKKVAQSAESKAALIQTEEMTKTALIMPFISALGYDTTDPAEFVAEYVADIGTKKGEKVDYAILKNSHPIIFIECKSCNVDLNTEHASQLLRYFATSTDTRFGVLTNGLVYQFYTDLVHKNKMDDRPFFTFDLRKYNKKDLQILQKFAKIDLDPEKIIKAPIVKSS